MRGDMAVNGTAHEAIERTGLAARKLKLANRLSHGEQRQLEIAMVLATTPRIILLDEPLAGMGPEESLRMVELIEALARDHTVILIEHDMDAVFRVASALTVMVRGEVLMTGTPAEVRGSLEVQEAYLGEEGAP